MTSKERWELIGNRATAVIQTLIVTLGLTVIATAFIDSRRADVAYEEGFYDCTVQHRKAAQQPKDMRIRKDTDEVRRNIFE